MLRNNIFKIGEKSTGTSHFYSGVYCKGVFEPKHAHVFPRILCFGLQNSAKTRNMGQNNETGNINSAQKLVIYKL